jgi:hypothetical protein
MAWLKIACAIAWSSMPKLVVNTTRPDTLLRTATMRWGKSRIRHSSEDNLAGALDAAGTKLGSPGAKATRILS